MVGSEGDESVNEQEKESGWLEDCFIFFAEPDSSHEQEKPNFGRDEP